VVTAPAPAARSAAAIAAAADAIPPTPDRYWSAEEEERRMRWMDDALRYYWFIRHGVKLAAIYGDCTHGTIYKSCDRVRANPEAMAYARALLKETHEAIVHADAAAYQARCAAEVALCERLIASASELGPRAVSTALGALAKLRTSPTSSASPARQDSGTAPDGGVTVTVPPSMLAQRPDDPGARPHDDPDDG
jgi:hypothetical protein